MSLPNESWKSIIYKDAVCADCGRSELGFGERFEWHHRDPATKEFDVSHAHSMDKFLYESAKCDLLCSTCHLKRHHENIRISPEGSFGVRLRAARQNSGLTQWMVAQSAGISRSYLCDLERCESRSPNLRIIESLAVALGIPASDLMTYRPQSDLSAAVENARELMGNLIQAIAKIESILVMTCDSN